MIKVIKEHSGLAIACVFLTCFAVSNVVTYDAVTLVTIPLSKFLEKICGIFRASSRMFYPVYYIIFFFMIILLWKLLDNRKKYACGVLLFIVMLQLFDLHECIVQKHQAINEKRFYSSYVDEDLKLKEIARDADCILLEEYEGGGKMIRTLAVWAFKNDLLTYFTVANSGSYQETAVLADEIKFRVRKDGNLGRNIIITTNENVADSYKQLMNCGVYEKEGNYFIYNNS